MLSGEARKKAAWQTRWLLPIGARLALVALALALSGCPEPDFTVVSAERVCTLHLHMNDGSPARQGEELFVRVVRPETGIGALPAPTREGHRFGAWNTAADGSGETVAANTPVCPMANFVVLYAQWEKRLHLEVSTDALAFSPINQLADIEVVVSGFSNPADAAGLEVEGEALAEWLRLEKGNNALSEGSKTWNMHARYAGTAFNEPAASIRLGLENIPQGYYFEQTPTLQVAVRVEDGTPERRISVQPGNMAAFNAYANTEAGRALHYRLVEDVVLEPPVPPETSNWVAIGSYSTPDTTSFTGSFDGGGHTISGLVIQDASKTHQGFFGRIEGEAVEIANIGLIDVHVSANNYVAGLVGVNHGGTIKNSYVRGNVSGLQRVGSLVGSHAFGTVQSSYATGHVSGSSPAGGLVGWNDGGRIENCVALNARVSASGANVGRVVGESNGTLRNNYAQSDMSLSSSELPPLLPGLTTVHGESTSAYGTESFWRGLGWDFDAHWQWNATTELPVLKNVGGTQNHTAPLP